MAAPSLRKLIASSPEEQLGYFLFLFFSNNFVMNLPRLLFLRMCESYAEICRGSLLHPGIHTFSILPNTVKVLSKLPLTTSF